jgi:biopolymer transport protein ExbD
MMQQPTDFLSQPLSRRPYRRRRARIEIIPMIDTVFFLLVFFIIFSLSLSRQAGIGIEPPEGGSPLSESHQILISMPSEGSILVEGQPVSEEDLAGKIKKAMDVNPDLVVVIAADRRVTNGGVVQVLELARKSGVKRFAIGTSLKGSSR